MPDSRDQYSVEIDLPEDVTRFVSNKFYELSKRRFSGNEIIFFQQLFVVLQEVLCEFEKKVFIQYDGKEKRKFNRYHDCQLYCTLILEEEYYTREGLSSPVKIIKSKFNYDLCYFKLLPMIESELFCLLYHDKKLGVESYNVKHHYALCIKINSDYCALDCLTGWCPVGNALSSKDFLAVGQDYVNTCLGFIPGYMDNKSVRICIGEEESFEYQLPPITGSGNVFNFVFRQLFLLAFKQNYKPGSSDNPGSSNVFKIVCAQLALSSFFNRETVMDVSCKQLEIHKELSKHIELLYNAGRKSYLMHKKTPAICEGSSSERDALSAGASKF